MEYSTIINQQIIDQGTILKEWDIKINQGIKTGFNEAFIVDINKRTELIAKDPKCADLIKPLLRGRDIQKWQPEFSDLWIIGTFPSLNLNIEDYPSIKEHLLSFGLNRLEQSGKLGARKKTDYKWFETQDSVTYKESFKGTKIIYQNISKSVGFDEKNHYSSEESFIMNGKSLKYLVSFFNSTLFKYYLKINFPKFYLNGNRKLSKKVCEQIPIKIPTLEQETIFNAMVDYVMFCLGTPRKLEVESEDSAIGDLKYKAEFFEDVINQLIFDLYFKDSIKKNNNYIFDEVANLVLPFNDSLTNEFKLVYVETLYDVMMGNKTIQRALIYDRVIPEIDCIYKELKKD